MVADTDGMVKVLSEKTSDRLLGVHIIGAVSDVCYTMTHNVMSLYRLLVN